MKVKSLLCPSAIWRTYDSVNLHPSPHPPNTNPILITGDGGNEVKDFKFGFIEGRWELAAREKLCL